MCNLGWTNERSLIQKVKSKIKLKYLHIYFLDYLPTYLVLPTFFPTYITYLNIDLNVSWPKFN
jgi:hypothetical protein